MEFLLTLFQLTALIVAAGVAEADRGVVIEIVDREADREVESAAIEVDREAVNDAVTEAAVIETTASDPLTLKTRKTTLLLIHENNRRRLRAAIWVCVYVLLPYVITLRF